MSQAGRDQAVLRVDNLKGLLMVLQAVKGRSSKQMCAVSLGKDGLTLRWEDDSKALQCSVFLCSALFAEYQCPWVRKVFGVPFARLLDSLAVFLTSSGAELGIQFPGLNDELICELSEEGEETLFCTYAQLDTHTIAYPPDLADYWEDPSSYFILPGAMLKEAIEDLEWAAADGSVRILLKRDPAAVSLSGNSSGSLDVALPVEQLHGFSCAETEVCHWFKYRHLRAAVANLPHPKDAGAQASSKVTIDSQGLLKITHMLSLQTPAKSQAGTYQGMAAFNASQLLNQGNTGIVTFMLLPVEQMQGEDSA